MPIDVKCPSCHLIVKVPDKYAGHDTRCPLCQKTFRAPMPASDALRTMLTCDSCKQPTQAALAVQLQGRRYCVACADNMRKEATPSPLHPSSTAFASAGESTATPAEQKVFRCPFCLEAIRYSAVRCKHCGQIVAETAPRPWKKIMEGFLRIFVVSPLITAVAICVAMIIPTGDEPEVRKITAIIKFVIYGFGAVLGLVSLIYGIILAAAGIRSLNE